MLAILDTLVPLLIFAIFALVSFLQKRRARQEHEEEFGPPELPSGYPQAGDRPERRKSWEEELRELLENRPAPPPVVREMPPPPVVYAPQVPPPPPPLVESHRHWQESVLSESEAVPLHRARFQESETRLEQAAHLNEQVTRKLAELKARPITYTTKHRERTSSDARRAIALIRNPQTVRSAVIASLILNPPAALTEERR